MRDDADRAVRDSERRRLTRSPQYLGARAQSDDGRRLLLHRSVRERRQAPRAHTAA